MTPDGTAAGWAAAQVAGVRDDPSGRMTLLARTYHRHQPFRRAAMSFMRWQAERGVLRPVDGDDPGSRWWRAVNEQLLRDGCEATARADGRSGEAPSRTVELWMSFIAAPSARTWYRAHNVNV